MLLVTWLVPDEACETLRTISCVAAPCSSTAAAMVVAMVLISRIRPVIAPMAVMARSVTPCTSPICPAISSVARPVWLASSFTSAATTAKPRPASPARAASMVAFRARRLVCDAMFEIIPTMSPIRVEVSRRACTRAAVWSASVMASSARPAEPCTCRPISCTEVPNSSAAAATVLTFVAASSAAAATVVDCAAVSAAAELICWAVA